MLGKAFLGLKMWRQQRNTCVRKIFPCALSAGEIRSKDVLLVFLQILPKSRPQHKTLLHISEKASILHLEE